MHNLIICVFICAHQVTVLNIDINLLYIYIYIHIYAYKINRQDSL